MMRVSALALWCALLGWVIASSGPGRARNGKATAQVNVADTIWPSEIQGVGRDEKKAKAEAVDQALKKLEAALTELDPPLRFWTPDREFVERILIEKPGYPGPDKESGEGANKLTIKTWFYSLRPLPVEVLYQLDQRERLDVRSHDRQLWMLRFVAATLIACFATLGIFHASRRQPHA